MDFSVALGDDLAVLAEASGVDHEAALHQLGTQLRLAVPSFLGLSITMLTFGHPVTFTALGNGAEEIAVRSSLHVPIVLLVDSHSGSSMTLFAAAADAFLDLAAEFGRSPGAGEATITLDSHLRLPPDEEGSGLTGLSTIHQAIGVLLAAGFDQVDAQAEVEAIAQRGGVTPVDAARVIIAAAVDRAHGPEPEPPTAD